MAYRELSKVLSEIGLDIAGKYNCYSLHYQTMKENEYVINFQGEEDRDRYRDICILLANVRKDVRNDLV